MAPGSPTRVLPILFLLDNAELFPVLMEALGLEVD